MLQFTDLHGRTICDGAQIHYTGTFPANMPTERQIRDGIALIKNGFLYFTVIDGNILRGTGLYWELDGEPCYDLIITEKEN